MKKTMTMTEILATRTLYKKKLMRIIGDLEEDNAYKSVGAVKTPLSQPKFISIKAKTKDTCIDGRSIEDAIENIKANYKSLTDILDNYIKLNRIINHVNSVVLYKMSNGEMVSLAELRTVKSDIVKETRMNVINTLRANLLSMQTEYQNRMNAIAEGEEKYIEIVSGTAATTTADDIAKRSELLKQYHEINDVVFVDPLDLENLVNKLSNEFDDFYSNTDFRLSEINATIKVDVDLDRDSGFFNIVSVGENCSIMGSF